MRPSNSTSEKSNMAVKRKSSKRVAPKINYTVSCVDDYLCYAKTDQTQSLFFRLAVDTIKHGVAEGIDVADVLTLPGSKDNTVMSINRSEWVPILKNAIKFYSKLKQYENCIDCQQLIATIK
jgi:hypothetical protein